MREQHLGLSALAHAMLRVASGAATVLVGLDLAVLRPARIDVAVVGALGASAFGAELIGSLPLGWVPLAARRLECR